MSTQPNVPLLGRSVPLADRFWQYVNAGSDDECWPWLGRRNNAGYGMTSFTPAPGERSVSVTATRAAWFVVHGVWPDKFMCHHCDNPTCVNTRHLFEGDQSDNMRDASAKGRAAGRYTGATHCIHGHEFTPENTYTNPNSGKRACRHCYRAYDLRRKARHG